MCCTFTVTGIYFVVNCLLQNKISIELSEHLPRQPPPASQMFPSSRSGASCQSSCQAQPKREARSQMCRTFEVQLIISRSRLCDANGARLTPAISMTAQSVISLSTLRRAALCRSVMAFRRSPSDTRTNAATLWIKKNSSGSRSCAEEAAALLLHPKP